MRKIINANLIIKNRRHKIRLIFAQVIYKIGIKPPIYPKIARIFKIRNHIIQ